MENRRPTGRPTGPKRCLFGRPAPEAVNQALDAQLRKIYDEDRAKMNSDYGSFELVNEIVVPQFYSKKPRRPHLKTTTQQAVVPPARREAARRAPLVSASLPSTSNASVSDSARDQPSDVNANAATVATVPLRTSPRKQPLAARRVVTRSKSRSVFSVTESSSSQAQASSSVSQSTITVSQESVTTSTTEVSSPTPIKGRLRQAKLTNYLPVRKRSGALKLGAAGDTASPLNKIARLEDEKKERAPNSPMRFAADETAKSDGEDASTSEERLARKVLRPSASESRLTRLRSSH